MKKTTPAIAAIAVLLAACSSIQTTTPQVIPSAPAPVSFDGNVAGQATDYVFMLVPDANPRTPGFSLRAGESLQVAMPVSFKRNLSVAIVPDKDTNLVLTKGWPQGAVPLAGQYRIDFDEKSNAMIITASRDVGLDGTNAPGIKVIHLRGRTFINPVPGDYPLMVTRVSAQGKPQSVWQSNLKVLDAAPAARLAPTNFHVMPGTNTDYQTVAKGQTTAHPLGVLLWGTHGAALTGGLLVQDTNGDKRLDPAVDKVVGGIVGAAPQGASGQAASSPIGADGKAVLSGEVLRSAGFPVAAGGGKPNPGLLAIEFRAGDKPGLYRPGVELIGGNAYQFTIEAK
jgi:hypothetical protein